MVEGIISVYYLCSEACYSARLAKVWFLIFRQPKCPSPPYTDDTKGTRSIVLVGLNTVKHYDSLHEDKASAQPDR